MLEFYKNIVSQLKKFYAAIENDQSLSLHILEQTQKGRH